jgi:3-phosphoshikimate 1-carboxyvinyltransferase
MNIKIHPSKINGCIKLPLSKSFYHRMIICKFLSGDLINIDETDSLDIKATFKGMSELLSDKQNKTIDCQESGTTLRLLIPICIGLGVNARFIGCNNLPKRDLSAYFECFKDDTSISLIKESDLNLPLLVSGSYSLNEYHINASHSSQFLSGLILGLSLCKTKVKLIVDSPLVSKSYVDITLSILDAFHVKYQKEDNYFILGGSSFQKSNILCEKDYSQAAFFMSLSLLTNSSLTLLEMNEFSLQGDYEVIKIYTHFGLQLEFINNNLILSKGITLNESIVIDLTNIPDLGPILILTSIFIKCKVVFTNCHRLLDKESDRLKSCLEVLDILNVTYELDNLYTLNVNKYQGQQILYEFDTYKDHRMAMSLIVISCILKAGSIINNVDCIDKSYPKFLSDISSIGVNYERIR